MIAIVVAAAVAVVVAVEVIDCDTNPAGMLLMAGFCFGGIGFLLIGLKRVIEDQLAGSTEVKRVCGGQEGVRRRCLGVKTRY